MPNSNKNPTTVESLKALEVDLNKAQAKYEIDRDNFEQFKAGRVDAFRKELPTLLTDDEKEQLSLEDDPLALYDILKAKEVEYVDNAIAQKEQELEKEREKLMQMQEAFEDLALEVAFKDKNPDADHEGLARFINEELSPRQLKELTGEANGDKEKFLDLAFELFNKKSGKQKKAKKEELPVDIDNIPGSGNIVDDGDNDIDVASLYRGR